MKNLVLIWFLDKMSTEDAALLKLLYLFKVCAVKDASKYLKLSATEQSEAFIMTVTVRNFPFFITK